MRNLKNALLASLGLGVAFSGLTLVAPVAQANPGGTALVINEVYGGGGNTGAVYTNDFIELFNPTDSPIPLEGKSLQYRSAAQTTALPGTSNVFAFAAGEVVPAHGYYLVQAAAGTTVSNAPLPVTPDAVVPGTNLNMSGTGGQIYLANVATAISPVTNGSAPWTFASDVIDFVGWGSTTATFEGADKAAATANATSTSRAATHSDTDSNVADFSTGTPSPLNSETIEGGDPEPTPLAAVDPGDKTYETGSAIPALQLTATGGTAPYTFETTALPVGLTLDGDTISGTPTTAGQTTVTVTAHDSADPVGSATAEFTITVSDPAPATPINEVQGTGPRSPFAPETGNGAGETKTVEGVVTAVYRTGGLNGFYLQSAGTGGTTDATEGSDAIFAYGGSTLANLPAGIDIGDSVRVTGAVSEFNDSTQISPPSPDKVVELGAPLAAVTPLEIAYPTTETAREAQEGMLLAPTDDLTITNVFNANNFGEIGLATGHTPLMQPTELVDDDDATAVQAVIDDNTARGVILDDSGTLNYLSNNTNKAIPLPWVTTANPPRVGAALTLQQPVILGKAFSAWRFYPRKQVTASASPDSLIGSDVATWVDTRANNLAPQAVGGDIQIATFNVLNYFNTTGEAYVAAGPQQNPPVNTACSYFTDRQGNRIGNNQCGVVTDGVNAGNGPRGAATAVSLARQEEKLAHAIVDMGAEVIGLEEVENSIKLPGETNRDDAVARIVQLLNDIEGPGTWKYVKSPGEAVTSAAIAEQDVIRPAFIYQPAAVQPVGGSDILFGTTEFANAREPLAQVFKRTGAPDAEGFAVIVNHFKSKGDNASPAPPATGDNANNPQTGAFNGDRVRQAQRLVQFAEDFAADRDVEAVFLAGDFNSYSMEDPVSAILAGGFTQVESAQEEESYSFSGLSGSLDHVFANPAAEALVTGADIWEINANEMVSFQYSRHNYNVLDLWQPTIPFATSDHNPEVVGLDLPDPAGTTYKEIQILGTNDFHGRLLPDSGNAAGAAPFATAINELRAENPNTVFAAAGDLIGASTFESFIQDDQPTIDALNAMGLDVSSVGNHEFDKGYDDLVNRVVPAADWPYLAANVVEPNGADVLANSWSTTVDGVEIGFVGAVTEDLLGLVNPGVMEGVSVTDVVDAVDAEAASLKSAGADLIVLLVHEGAPSTECTNENFTDPQTVFGRIAQTTSADVDAIISGHTHLAYNCKFTVDEWVTDGRAVTKRPVVSAGQYGTNLNQLVFKFDALTGELAGKTQDVIATAGVGYAPDPAVQAIVDDAVAFAETQGNVVLGQMEGPFKRAFRADGSTENRGGESTLGNLVAEIQRAQTQLPDQGIESDIAFMNPGGLRADMLGTANGGVRDLTYRQAADVQPFANTLVTMDLTGAQIETVLEQQWQRTQAGGVPSRPFLRLGVSQGFTYTYTETPEAVSAPNQPVVNTFKGEVTGMWLDGVPIDPAATYSVTVNSFLGTGGDNFWELANGANKVDSGQIDLATVVDYMEANAFATPLPVDYSQRAVEVTFPNGAPTTYEPGDALAFDVASWSMSAPGDVQDSEILIKVGDTTIGTLPVDSTISTAPELRTFDNTGTATANLTIPADTAARGDITLVGATTGTEVPTGATLEVAPVDIQVIGTNDFHGRLLADGSNAGGAAMLAGAIKQLRTENPNTVFAAAGDLIGASTFESFIQHDEPTIEALNEAGLDVSAAGNHEFDAGYEDLVGRVQNLAEWEYIAANVVEPAGRDDLAETWTQEFDGVTVGFVGAVTENLPTLVAPAGIEGVTVTDIVDATNSAAADLKAAGADIVLLLVHEGSGVTNCAAPDFLDPNTVWGNITQNTSADVDAIISGHTHLAYNCHYPVQEWVDAGRAVTERPVVSAGQYGTFLNQLKFRYDTDAGELALLPEADTQKILPLTGAGLPYTPDPATATIVQNAVNEAGPLGAVPLGEIAAPLNRAKRADGTTERRGGESTLGNLVAEVQRWATENSESGSAQIAFMNPGGLRQDMGGTVIDQAWLDDPANAAYAADYQVGDRIVTYKQAAVVQPFANTLVNMDLTGAQIEAVLEQQWQRNAAGTAVPDTSRPFLRLGVSDGFRYTYEEQATNVNGFDTYVGDVTGMWLNGEPIDPAATYSVTVNSFLASGGDNFHTFKAGVGRADTGKIDLSAMVDYMDAFGTPEPMLVDYAQRAVEVHNVADGYEVGTSITFDVASWIMSAPSDPKDTEIEVSIGDVVLGTVPVNATIDAAFNLYDRPGTAAIDLELPAAIGVGEHDVTLTGLQTGTEVTVPITVAEHSFADGTAPTIVGEPMVGETLTATAGTWTPTPDSVTFQWYADGVAIADATESTLELTPDLAGAAITVEATAHATDYADDTQVSEPTAAVALGELTVVTPPSITGTTQVGKTLTGVPGDFDGADPIAVTYQWLANGTPISGATGLTLKLKAAQVGKLITLRATASADGFEDASATSTEVGPVKKGKVAIGVTHDPDTVHKKTTKPKLTIKVSNADGLEATGKVSVIANGKTFSASLSSGKAVITLPPFPTVGKKTVKVKYLGDANLQAKTKYYYIQVVR